MNSHESERERFEAWFAAFLYVGADLVWEAWQARAALASPQTPPAGWLPIESAPKDGSLVLLGHKYGAWVGRYVPVYPSGYVPANPWSSVLLNHDHMAEKWPVPTHWQPLPAPPNAEPVSRPILRALTEEESAADLAHLKERMEYWEQNLRQHYEQCGFEPLLACVVSMLANRDQAAWGGPSQ